MPVTPQDQEFSTTARPTSRAYVAPGGGSAAAPASSVARATVPGSSTPIPTEKVTEPKAAGAFAKYLPLAIGAAVLFYFLRRK